MSPHRRNERGQTTLLIVGFAMVVALVVAVAVDSSAAYLRRQGLANLADGAALAAADGVKAEQAYSGRLGEDTPIDPGVARRYAAEYLAQVRAERRFQELSMRLSVDGGTVTVQLDAPVDLPIAPPDWEDAPVVTGTAAAYVVTGG